MSYADTIADLAETYLTEQYHSLTLKPLLLALGCRRSSRETRGWSVDIPAIPEPGNELLICDTLWRALRTHLAHGATQTEDAFALMDGLGREGRWENCRTDIDDAYHLAALCVALGADRLHPDLKKPENSPAPLLCNILNAWLEPTDPFVVHPNSMDIARAFFGDAWYEFCITQSGLDQWSLLRVIYETRPTFLHEIFSDAKISLPVLDEP